MLRRRREEEIVRKMLHDDSWLVEEGRAEIRGKECWRRRSWITNPMKTSRTYGFRGFSRGSLGVGRVLASNKGFQSKQAWTMIHLCENLSNVFSFSPCYYWCNEMQNCCSSRTFFRFWETRLQTFDKVFRF